jgi:hypothetical protein
MVHLFWGLLCVTALVAQVEPLAVTAVGDAEGSTVRVRNAYDVPTTAFVVAREIQRPRWWVSGGPYLPPSSYLIGGIVRRQTVRDVLLDVVLPPGESLDF